MGFCAKNPCEIVDLGNVNGRTDRQAQTDIDTRDIIPAHGRAAFAFFTRDYRPVVGAEHPRRPPDHAGGYCAFAGNGHWYHHRPGEADDLSYRCQRLPLPGTQAAHRRCRGLVIDKAHKLTAAARDMCEYRFDKSNVEDFFAELRMVSATPKNSSAFVDL